MSAPPKSKDAVDAHKKETKKNLTHHNHWEKKSSVQGWNKCSFVVLSWTYLESPQFISDDHLRAHYQINPIPSCQPHIPTYKRLNLFKARLIITIFPSLSNSAFWGSIQLMLAISVSIIHSKLSTKHLLWETFFHQLLWQRLLFTKFIFSVSWTHASYIFQTSLFLSVVRVLNSRQGMWLEVMCASSLMLLPFPPAGCWCPGQPWKPSAEHSLDPSMTAWNRPSPTLLVCENYNCIIIYLFGGWFVNSTVNTASTSNSFIHSLIHVKHLLYSRHWERHRGKKNG